MRQQRVGEMKEMVGGCCVCSDESGWDENPLVYCDGEGCDVAVHQACYGIVTVPLGPWFCRKCELQEKHVRLRCELCPSRSGALKRTDTAGWAHVVCALYIPEVRFGDVATMEPILVSIVPPERFSKSCCLCEMSGRASKASSGACMSCNKPGCRLSFHVTCAQHSGLLCEEQAHNMNNVTYCGYCPHHYAKLKRGHNMKPVPAFKPTTESVTPDTSPEKRPPPPISGSRSERKKKLKCSRSPRPGGHGDAAPPLAFTDSSNSSCPSATELEERRDRSQQRVPLLADEGENKEERTHRSEDMGKESGHLTDERSSDHRADEHARDQPSYRSEERSREPLSHRGEDQSSLKSLKDQASLISSKDQSSHRSEDRGKDQSHRSEGRGKDQSSHRSEGRLKDQSSHRSEDRGKDQSSHRSEDQMKDQASRRAENRVKDESSHRAEDRLKDQSSHRPGDLGKDQSSYRTEHKRSLKFSKLNQDVLDQCGELSSNQSVAEAVSQLTEYSETRSDHNVSEASTTVPSPALSNHSNSYPSQVEMPASASAYKAAQNNGPAPSADGSRPDSVKDEPQVDSTIAPGFTTANFTETVVTPSCAVFGDQSASLGTARAEPDGVEPAEVAPAQPQGRERASVKQEPAEAEARPACQQAPPPAPGTLQLPAPAAPAPALQASAAVAGGGVKRAAPLQSAEKERRKRKAPGRRRRGELVVPAAAAQQEVAAADSATGEAEPPPPAASAASPVGDRTSPTSTSAAPSVNGISAVHMIGNQLNPSSLMAEKLGLSLAQEVAEQAGYLDPPPGPLVGPPAPGSRAQQGKRAGGSSPSSLTELLERQWEQGSQFLLEQSQHFDLAALLSCLFQLRQENQQMEEHMASVTQRRDHLLAVQARLSVPLQTAGPAVVSARANAVRHHQQTAVPAAGTRLTPAPVENGVSEGHHPAAAAGARLSGGRPHNARNGGAAAAASHGSGAGGAPLSAAAAPGRQQMPAPPPHARAEPFRGATGGGLSTPAGTAAPPGYPQCQLVSPPPSQPPSQSDRQR